MPDMDPPAGGWLYARPLSGGWWENLMTRLFSPSRYAEDREREHMRAGELRRAADPHPHVENVSCWFGQSSSAGSVTFTGQLSPENKAQIARLWLLACGCDDHPAYRGRTSPTEDCGGCLAIFAARLNLQ